MRPVAYLFISTPSISRGFSVLRELVTPILTIFPLSEAAAWVCPNPVWPVSVWPDGWLPPLPPHPAADRTMTADKTRARHLPAILPAVPFVCFISLLLKSPEHPYTRSGRWHRIPSIPTT